MDERERIKTWGREADSIVVAPSNIHSGVWTAIARRRQLKTGMRLHLAVTGLAIFVALLSLKSYSLDWKMATSSWPGISQYVLFQESK